MSTAPLSFTGVSTFSNDFQSILARESAIAQLPVTQLQNQQSDNVQKKQLLTGLNSSVDALASAIAVLGSIGANKALTATSSDPASVSVANTGSSQPATYTISNVTSIASAASETSLIGYADTTTAPVSQNGNLSLVFGTGPAIPITLSAGQNNLVGLRDAINGKNAGVTASILTTGTGLTPNYLVVSANTSGANPLQLSDVDRATNLLTATNQGADAMFKLNGVNIDKTTNSINDVIPGVTFTVLAKPPSDVTLTLSGDRSQVTNALSDFATKYNAAVAQVDGQVGSNAGLLGGDFMIHTVADDLRQLGTYQGSGNMSLAALGVTFDTTGKMSFDPTSVNAMSDSTFASALSFLGSSTTGFGAIASRFTQLSDPITGLIQAEENGIDKTNLQLTDRISTLNARIAVTQTGLTLRLQQADAAVANLQSQQQVLSASVQAIDLALFGKDFGIAGATAA
jgi:flagellar hook-associated protein 2